MVTEAFGLEHGLCHVAAQYPTGVAAVHGGWRVTPRQHLEAGSRVSSLTGGPCGRSRSSLAALGVGWSGAPTNGRVAGSYHLWCRARRRGRES